MSRGIPFVVIMWVSTAGDRPGVNNESSGLFLTIIHGDAVHERGANEHWLGEKNEE